MKSRLRLRVVAGPVGFRQSGPMKLNEKRKRFCYEYVKDLNGAAAYRRVYGGQDGRQGAARLLTNDDVSGLIVKLHRERLDRVELSADDILRRLLDIATASPRGLVDDEGRMLPVHELSPQAASSVAQFDLTEGDDGVTRMSRVRLVDRVAALQLLSKYLGIIPERHLHAHAVVSLSPDELHQCSDDQLRRVEEATEVLTVVQQELSKGNEPAAADKVVKPGI
jgi:phage terminase small subunit